MCQTSTSFASAWAICRRLPPSNPAKIAGIAYNPVVSGFSLGRCNLDAQVFMWLSQEPGHK